MGPKEGLASGRRTRMWTVAACVACGWMAGFLTGKFSGPCFAVGTRGAPAGWAEAPPPGAPSELRAPSAASEPAASGRSSAAGAVSPVPTSAPLHGATAAARAVGSTGPRADTIHPDFRPRRPDREGVGYNENANCEHKSLLPPDSRLTDYMILSIYFTSIQDPQRKNRDMGGANKGHRPKDNDAFIGKWHQSVKALGLPATIFHDGLGQNFTRFYTTDKIKFIQVPLLTRLSPIDERFVIWLEYLRDNPAKYVLMTDLNDVVLANNPFDFMEQKRRDYDLWVGSEGMAGRLEHNRWMTANYKDCYGPGVGGVGGRDKGIVYNSGVIGGKYPAIMKLLEHMLCEFVSIEEKRAHKVGHHMACDMAVFSHCLLHYVGVRDGFGKPGPHALRVFTGSPFHSGYKKKEDPAKKKYYIYHK